MGDLEEITDTVLDGLADMLSKKYSIALDADELDDIRDTIDAVLEERLLNE